MIMSLKGMGDWRYDDLEIVVNNINSSTFKFYKNGLTLPIINNRTILHIFYIFIKPFLRTIILYQLV